MARVCSRTRRGHSYRRRWSTGPRATSRCQVSAICTARCSTWCAMRSPTMRPAPGGCIAPTPSKPCWPRRTRHGPRWAQTRCGNSRCSRCGCRAWRAEAMGQLRAIYGASMSPDAPASAHLIDEGGYPRAVQRFLRGWRASSSRDVELPVEGPVSRVIHSADGQWLACEVAPSGGTRKQIWVVTTDPDDRMARRIDGEDAGTAELIAWDGTRVAAILTGEDGVGRSCLIDPADGRHTVLDSRSGGRLVDAWAGASLIRVGPRGYHEMVMLLGQTEIALLPSDPGSCTTDGVILDDHYPRRIRYGPTGEMTKLYYPGPDGSGYVRTLIRSDNGCEHARLLEVTATPDGVTYFVVAERPDCDLDEFVVSDDLSTIALLWNLQGRSELQILEYIDNTLTEPIPLPGLVASDLSISAGGSMVAMTVQGPSLPRTVELVDPRSRQWEPIDREPS